MTVRRDGVGLLLWVTACITGCPDSSAVTVTDGPSSTATTGETTGTSGPGATTETSTGTPSTGTPTTGTTTTGTTTQDPSTTETTSTTEGVDTADTTETTSTTSTTSATDDTDTSETRGSSTEPEELCGDGVVQRPEECDLGPANANNGACTLQCKFGLCGDGLVYDAGGGLEQCDDGPGNGPGMACNEACQFNVCGDGDPGPGEECDDGNLDDGDGCSASCTLVGCGNGVVEPGEACDDGKNGDQDDGCTDLCKPPSCGDGFVQASLGEACDDGNQDDHDACLHTCTPASCGDSIVQVGVEECDDGNLEPGDLCSKICTSTKITKIATGEDHTCILFDTGRVRCWGAGWYGAHGYGHGEALGDEPGELPTPDVPIGGKAVALDVGGDFTCVLLDSGQLRCFGGNSGGALGIGNTENIGDEPGEMPGPLAKVGGSVASFATGGGHVCAILLNGRVRCWGSALFGQTGYETDVSIGDGPNELPPADVKGIFPASMIAAGAQHTCAWVDDFDNFDNYLSCWGNNSHGQLGQGVPLSSVGDGTNEMPPFATLLGGEKAVEVALGWYHTCARFADGNVRCWGMGEYGQLGYGNTDDIGQEPAHMPPPVVDVGGPVVQIVAGDRHTCALLATGKVRCWGYGGQGALGYGNTETIGDEPGEMPPPDVEIGGEVAQISARHGSSTCALLTDNSMRCWGEHGAYAYGSHAHIGDDETPASAGPVPF